MRDHETLKRDARAAYERARFISATRIAALVIPLTALCVFETRSILRTGALGLVLLVLAVALRWRQHHGFATVSAGLRSGLLPLAAALGLCRFAPSCPPHIALALCIGAGLLAGAVAGRSLTGLDLQRHQQLSAATVAALTAALGCLAFGAGIALGAGAAVAAGVMITVALPRRATA